MRLNLIMNDINGVNLEQWLSQNRQILNNKKILYVVKADMDSNPPVYKFGIAGSTGDKNGAYNRLSHYNVLYGKRSQCNPNNNNCVLGVKLYAIYGTNFNYATGQYVSVNNSAVKKVENKLKNLHIVRGNERTDASIGNIIRTINQFAYTTTDVVSGVINRPVRTGIARKQPGFYAGMGS